MRLIDADALLNEVFERHCKNCDKRKGIKNGAYRIIYEIGEAPCRACEIDDITDYLEEAPTVDAVEVIRCWQCKYQDKGENESGSWNCCSIGYCDVEDDYFCWWAERRQT